jgi:tetratricopeptide (TPR) repeat protein
MGLVKFHYDWSWSEAEKEFRRAIQLDANYAQAHIKYANLLAATGRLEEGIEEAKRARELDPLNLLLNANFAYSLYLARRFDDAIEQCQKTLEMEPRLLLCHWHLFSAFWQKKNYEEALLELKKFFFSLHESSKVPAAIEKGFVESGYRGAMLAAAREQEAQSESRYISPVTISEFYLHADQEEQACTWLEKAIEERNPLMVYLDVDPRLDPLRTHPCFKDLLRRMNFPE